MPARKFAITDLQVVGQAPSQMLIMRAKAVNDVADAEAQTANAGIRSSVIIRVYDTMNDPEIAGKVVGDFLYERLTAEA